MNKKSTFLIYFFQVVFISDSVNFPVFSEYFFFLQKKIMKRFAKSLFAVILHFLLLYLINIISIGHRRTKLEVGLKHPLSLRELAILTLTGPVMGAATDRPEVVV